MSKTTNSKHKTSLYIPISALWSSGRCWYVRPYAVTLKMPIRALTDGYRLTQPTSSWENWEDLRGIWFLSVEWLCMTKHPTTLGLQKETSSKRLTQKITKKRSPKNNQEEMKITSSLHLSSMIRTCWVTPTRLHKGHFSHVKKKKKNRGKSG